MEIFDILARDWKPGIGDPTFMGWLTVIAYFAAAVLLLHKRRLTLSLFPSHWQQHRRILLVLALLMIGLGLNKQLDLQTWLTDVGRDLANAQGWYGRRRVVQIVVLSILAAIGIGLAVVIARVRGILGAHRLALLGMAFLVCFVLMRASSFFKVDRMLGFELAGVKVNWLMELVGIGIIIASVVKSLVQLRKARRVLRQRRRSLSSEAR